MNYLILTFLFLVSGCGLIFSSTVFAVAWNLATGKSEMHLAVNGKTLLSINENKPAAEPEKE